MVIGHHLQPKGMSISGGCDEPIVPGRCMASIDAVFFCFPSLSGRGGKITRAGWLQEVAYSTNVDIEIRLVTKAWGDSVSVPRFLECSW